MDIKVINQDEGIKKLAYLACNRSLIPFFGAGFTSGCESFRKKVPNGKLATEIMNNIIINTSFGKINKNELSDNFNETSDLFFESVPQKEQVEFLSNYFINVHIEEYKTNFLKIDWPYAYTINIDDGIENTKEFVAILPYKKLKKNYNGLKYLYKLHGDAKYEVNYDTSENIVFRTSQYISSIKSEHNSDFYYNIKNDYLKSNILFIGCSMINEPDLKFIYEQIDADYNNIRAVIRKEKPTFKQEKLLLSHGVNTVIIVDDFDLFYKKFLEEYYKIKSDTNCEKDKYSQIKIEEINAKNDVIKYISGTSIYDINNNSFKKSDLHILRTVITDISQQLEKNNCLIIKGRRFSGKTFILANLYELFNKYETYYFSSQMQIDCYYIKKKLQSKNCLFIFDSDSISQDAYKLISSSKSLVTKNNNKIIIATNSNDNYILGIFEASFVEIENYFDENELTAFNKMVDKYGLIRRYRRKTNLDYLLQLSKEQKIEIPMLSDFSQNANLMDKVLLFLLAVNDKVYYSDAIILDIMPDYIGDFLKKYQILVEEVETEKEEKESHSNTKIIHNSKMVILELVRNYDKNDIIEIIKYIVTKFKDNEFRSRIYINSILFDTLNQIFGGKSGAGKLIFNVYDSLEELLCNSPDYWLQRAKSIYRISNENINELNSAYQYAKKAYCDGNNNIKLKSSLTISLICGYICNLLKDSDENIMTKSVECIKKGYEAAFSGFYNKNQSYLNNELRGGRMKKNSYDIIKNVCKSVIESNKYDSGIIEKACKLKEKLEMIQNQYKN